MQIATLAMIVVLLVAYCLKEFLFSYSQKKGENHATKEDIADITQEIEHVRSSHLQELEKVRAELSSDIHKLGFRYSQEFQILRQLMSCLVELRDSALNLAPKVDFHPEGADLEEVKRSRLSRFHSAHRELYLAREINRPFYSTEVFEKIYALEDKCFSGAVHYEIGPQPGLMEFGRYWDTVARNRKEIERISNEAMSEIRRRIESWEHRGESNS